MPKGDESPVVHDRDRRGVPAVSAEARSRKWIHERLGSSSAYAKFAAAAGSDLFDGEPIERFAAVGKLDERTLRMRAQELREAVFAEALRARAGATEAKRIQEV